MVFLFRSLGLVLTLCACAIVDASAQAQPLVFTVSPPEQSPSDTTVRATAVVEERGLAMWSGTDADFGVGVTLARREWTVRSITSITTLPLGGRDRPTFQQVELVRPLFSTGSISIAGGGGIRQEWDGSRVLIGRVLAGSAVGRGRLQGSVVVERTVGSPLRHDAADVVTSVGWSRPVGRRISVGVEGIGQDFEGLWNPAELDGGAKLLVGPSLHVQSRSGAWSASLIAGPVAHPRPATSPADAQPGIDLYGGRHFGMFASAIWIPSLHR